MRIFNIEIRKVPDQKASILDQAEENARAGLIKAKLELRHHTLLLEQMSTREKSEEADRERRLLKEAIERDEKSITNWETQLKAINYERNN